MATNSKVGSLITGIITPKTTQSEQAKAMCRVSSFIPTELNEWILDYLYQQKLTTGNYNLTLSGVIIDAVELLRQQYPDIPHRPEHARKALSRGRKTNL